MSTLINQHPLNKNCPGDKAKYNQKIALSTFYGAVTCTTNPYSNMTSYPYCNDVRGKIERSIVTSWKTGSGASHGA